LNQFKHDLSRQQSFHYSKDSHKIATSRFDHQLKMRLFLFYSASSLAISSALALPANSDFGMVHKDTATPQPSFPHGGVSQVDNGTLACHATTNNHTSPGYFARAPALDAINQFCGGLTSMLNWRGFSKEANYPSVGSATFALSGVNKCTFEKVNVFSNLPQRPRPGIARRVNVNNVLDRHKKQHKVTMEMAQNACRSALMHTLDGCKFPRF
jgi:hypothetical protein